MAVYCYSNRTGIIEAEFPMGEAKPFVIRGGKRFTRDLGAEQRSGDPHAGPSAWGEGEFCSRAMGCHPKQVAEFEVNAHKHGHKTVHFDKKTGKAVFTSKRSRQRYMRRFGYTDLDGGYSDP